jgi:hypothetical protein
MADQRKTFRPRFLVLGASCLLVGSFLPALAEDAGLKNGAAALDAGKYDSAVRMLSSTINSDTASPGDAAKALYLRGIAYRKLGQSAHAISDLGADSPIRPQVSRPRARPRSRRPGGSAGAVPSINSLPRAAARRGALLWLHRSLRGLARLDNGRRRRATRREGAQAAVIA